MRFVLIVVQGGGREVACPDCLTDALAEYEGRGDTVDQLPLPDETRMTCGWCFAHSNEVPS